MSGGNGGCNCGCGETMQVTQVTAAPKAAGCGCSDVAHADRGTQVASTTAPCNCGCGATTTSIQDEVAELKRLKASIDARLEELSTRN